MSTTPVQSRPSTPVDDAAGLMGASIMEAPPAERENTLANTAAKAIGLSASVMGKATTRTSSPEVSPPHSPIAAGRTTPPPSSLAFPGPGFSVMAGTTAQKLDKTPSPHPLDGDRAPSTALPNLELPKMGSVSEIPASKGETPPTVVRPDANVPPETPGRVRGCLNSLYGRVTRITSTVSNAIPVPRCSHVAVVVVAVAVPVIYYALQANGYNIPWPQSLPTFSFNS